VAERVLTQRELNRALLARQRLLERASGTIPRLVESIGGLQTQYAPSAYVGLWSRLDGFERDDLTRALERRSVVQATLMRVTIHIVSKRDFPVLSAGLRDARLAWWVKAHRGKPTARQVETAARKVAKLLADGPQRRDELVAELGIDASTWNGAALRLELVRVPPSGTWERRRADLYGLPEPWVGSSRATEADGLELLVRRYLGGFGPAAVKDVAGWAGVPPASIAPTIEAMTLRRFRDESGQELIDLPRAPLPDGDTPAPPRFLPTWDATLLVHQRRTGVLPEEHRPRVFSTKTPQSVATVMVDGRVVGSWRHERGRIVVEPFERLSKADRSALDDEAERLAAFHA
jgi:hypothetical protein